MALLPGLECGGCSIMNLLANCSSGVPTPGPAPPLSVSPAPLYELGSLVPIHVDEGFGGSKGSSTEGSRSSKNEVALRDVYELDRQALGRGSYGEVWGATHRQTGARRAVKTVDKMVVAKTRGDFLRRELDILRQLDHPNVLRLYEAFEDAQSIYLVLELCEGGDLLERVATPHEQMPEREAAVLLAQMLGGIQHLHLHGVIHRDVKPENFLFTRRELDREPLPPEVAPMKLIDFGLSRRLSRESGVLMTPKIGTTEYMAPEAFGGQVAEAQADRIDMWSVGVVLHTMLTGHFPSPRLAREPPDEYLSTPYWGRFSAKAKDLLSRLLHFKPAQRLTTTLALRHAWLAQAVDVGELDNVTVSGIPEAIRSYAMLPGLRRLVLVAAAREVDDRDVFTIRRLFQKLSLECDGMLSRQSLECVSCMTGTLGAAANELLRAFDSVDTDGSGTIDWTELVAAALCTPGALARSVANSDGDSNFEGAAGNADAEGDDACWRAFDLLRHGNGAVSCEAPASYTQSEGMYGQKKLSRQWYLM